MLNRLNLSPLKLARAGLVWFSLGMVVLHLLPHPMLSATTGASIPYDPRLNFMSEYVRTQYGPLMTLNFLALSFAAGFGASALNGRGLKREAGLLGLAALCLVFLAVFQTDLAVLAADGNQCGIPDRIEPCTFSGLIHNFMPPGVFGSIGLVWLSLRERRRQELNRIVQSAWICLGLAVVLLGASTIWLQNIPGTNRHWAGLTQRSIAIAGISWIWILFREHSRKKE
jgi:hypothetical protein